MENKRKNALSGVIALAVLAAILTVVPSALASYPANCTYFNPEDSTGVYCQNNTIVQVRVNTSVPSLGGGVDIYFDPTCVNITAADFSGSPWTALQGFTNYGNYVRVSSFNLAPPAFSGDNLLANITLHCINDMCDCTSFLNFSNVGIGDINSVPIITTTHNGTIDCTGAAGPINVDIRADSITGNIFDVSGYTINPGMVTEDAITIDNQTAMGAMVVYCQENGINVSLIMHTTLGEYVIQIGDNASDYDSWCYAVDETSPWVGGAQYGLSGGEKVHWFNYNLPYYQVLTTLNTTSIKSGDYLTATVTWKNTTGTYPLNGATVYETATAYTQGTFVGTTGPDGNCTFQADETGRWYVYAEHSTYGKGIYNYPAPYYDCWLPDLEITDKSEEWVSLAEKTYNITYTVKNNGTAEAGASTTSIKIDGAENATDSVPALAAGASYTGTVGPFTMSGDNDTIMICADRNDAVAESNEDNNCLENEFGNPGMPDLEITDIWTEVIKVGNKFNTTIIHYNITNNGDAEAGRSVSNLTVDGNVTKKRDGVKPLAVGETRTTEFFRYRSATPPNTIKVCADYNPRIAESNETNNCLEVTCT